MNEYGPLLGNPWIPLIVAVSTLVLVIVGIVVAVRVLRRRK